MVPGERSGSGNSSRRKKALGRAGESVARKYLEGKGKRVLATNFRRRSGEIDIVFMDGNALVFCEVKTRLGGGDAIEGYSLTQQRRMVELSQLFIAENEMLIPKVFDLRYDVIVVGDGEGGVLEVKDHLLDAYRPDD